MSDKYRESVLKTAEREGWCEEYLDDWLRVYDETGMDMRDFADGMDVDAFLEAYEEDDLDAMIMLT